MKLTILVIGKTSAPFLKEGIDIYLKRLAHYCKYSYTELPDSNQKGISPNDLKKREGELILKQLKADDLLVLCDERGEQFTSREFSVFLQRKMNSGAKNMTLVIGGAFGFSDELYARAQHQISFSKMTFSHEMIRLILCEQLYRAHTILKGESYHHD